jgi:hypothetical protein
MALAGMAFVLLLTLTLVLGIGGVVLLKPLMRHLGEYLEARAEMGRAFGGRSPEQVERLLSSLETVVIRLEALEERQDFTEKLLERPKDPGEGR